MHSNLNFSDSDPEMFADDFDPTPTAGSVEIGSALLRLHAWAEKDPELAVGTLWRAGVPAPRYQVERVRDNLSQELIEHEWHSVPKRLTREVQRLVTALAKFLTPRKVRRPTRR